MFTVGDKVVPVSKSFWGSLEDSISWQRANEMGQPFLYVTGFKNKYTDYGTVEVIVVSEYEDESGDYFLESDLIPYEEECCVAKFEQGDKVVPVSKSVWNSLNDSRVWQRAKDEGQPYLIVRKYTREHKKNEMVVCASVCGKVGGDYFLESDLVPYIENEIGGIAVSEQTYKVGDRFFFGGRLFELNYERDIEYYFTDIENFREVYTCHPTPDALVESFVSDLKEGTNYLFPQESDGFKETIEQLEEVLEEVKQEKQYAKMEAERQAYIAEERKKEARMWEQKYTEMQMITSQMERELEREELSHGNTKAQLGRDIEARDMTIRDHSKELEELNEQVKRMNGMLDDMTYDLKQANRIIDALLGMHGH